MNKAISSYRLINISKNCSAVNTVNSEMVLLPYCHSALLPFYKELLTNVTKHAQNRQLLSATCFIIHVGLECIGEKTYA